MVTVAGSLEFCGWDVAGRRPVVLSSVLVGDSRGYVLGPDAGAQELTTVTEKVDVAGLETADVAALGFPAQLVLLKTVAHSLKILHDLRIVHSDLKPANVMIKRTELGYMTKLIDFDSSYLAGSPPPLRGSRAEGPGRGHRSDGIAPGTGGSGRPVSVGCGVVSWSGSTRTARCRWGRGG